jgi:GGDEF domain-containing protein
MSRPPRRRRDPALLRGRFRTLFFAALALTAFALGARLAVAPALVGLLAGVLSIRVARRRGQDLAHTFVAIDWLLLGCAFALAGGAESWLLPAVPVLTFGELASAPRGDWPYLLAPSLLLLIVLAIADPSLGGNRLAGVLKLTVLVAGGVVAAVQVRRPRTRDVRRPALVDATTGLYTGERLPALLDLAMRDALAAHRPLGVAHLRLEHFEDCRNFLGSRGSEEVVKGVARRIQRRLDVDDAAFRVAPDAFVLVLPERTTGQARELSEAIARDVCANLIAGRRQTLASGAASFPTIRDRDALLAAARGEAPPAAAELVVAGPPVPLAAAQ